MRLKHYKTIITAYSAVLLASLAVFYLFPRYASMQGRPGGANDYSGLYEAFYEAAFDGRLEEYDGACLREQQSFNYRGDRLEIKTDGQYTDIMIIVERTAPESGQIVVSEYMSDAFLTVKAEPFSVSLSGGSLIIANPPFYNIVFTAFYKERPVTQFQENDPPERDYLFLNSLHHRLLYFKIPAGVNISYDSNSLNLFELNVTP